MVKFPSHGRWILEPNGAAYSKFAMHLIAATERSTWASGLFLVNFYRLVENPSH